LWVGRVVGMVGSEWDFTLTMVSLTWVARL
jgi:hypothetical protein